MAAPLIVRSHHSLGLGTATLAELIPVAVAEGHRWLVLADLETLAGQVEFHARCRAAGIQPLTGVELREGFEERRSFGRRAGRVILLARSWTGYQRLSELVTTRRRTNGAAPDPVASLGGETEGLWVLSDVPAVIEQLLASGADRASVRLLATTAEARIEATARRLGVACVGAPEVAMLSPGDAPLQELMVALHLRVPLRDVQRRRLAAPEAHPWATRPVSAPEEAERLAAGCALDLLDRAPTLPALPGGLRRRCLAALESGRAAGRWQGAVYDERLAAELEVLEEQALERYLVLVATIVDHARDEGIEVAVRGSAVASLAGHLLALSDVDPVALGLSFERFAHPLRTELPDVDVDLPSERRDEVLRWVRRHFGVRAAMVSAHHTWQERSALKEGMQALEGALSAVEATALAGRLIGRLRHRAIHPGGVVIAGEPLARVAPLERAAGGVLITQYDHQSVAHVGLVKIDLLGNRCLSELQEVSAHVGRRVDAPLDDPETLATIDRADTMTCFQLESPAMRALLSRLPVRCFEDLTAALALVRPGPASGGARDAYIRRVHGHEAPEPRHPLLAPVTRQTRGLLLYDEDVSAVLAAGLSRTVAEGDALRRRIIAAGDDATEQRALRDAFVAEATAGGVEAPEVIWDEVVRFAAYSFSKSHAVSYARLAFRSAYAWTHHPALHACAVLNHHGGLYPLRSLAAAITRRGVRLLPPSVLRSEAACTLEDRAVRIGLGLLKHLTRRTATRLLRQREWRAFRDVSDLLDRVAPHRREQEALILSGACDGLPPLAPERYPVVHEALLKGLRGDLSPSAFREAAARSLPDDPEVRRWSALVRARNELRFLEMHPSAHPMAVLRSEADRTGCLTVVLARDRVGESVRIGAVVAAARTVEDVRQQAMQFITLEDETGLLEAVRFGSAARRGAGAVTTPGPYLITGQVAEDHGHVHLVVSDLRPFHHRSRA